MIRGLLCTRCNVALGSLQDSPHLTEKATAYLRAALARLTDDRSFRPGGKIMPSTDGQAETGKGCRLMRSAILRELRCPPGEAEDSAADKLRLIARRLVDKAADGDLQAIKEVLDRIDGKTVAGPGDGEPGPQQVSIRWKDSPPRNAGSGHGMTGFPITPA
jgi:Recombination endonuclease VII